MNETNIKSDRKKNVNNFFAMSPATCLVYSSYDNKRREKKEIAFL